MQLTTSTITAVISTLTELVNNASLNVSRNRYDFYADRLRVATTEKDLLSAVNRYSELLGCPVLTEHATANILRASSAADAKSVYQWLREQPKIAIAMTKRRRRNYRGRGNMARLFMRCWRSYSRVNVWPI